MSRALPALLLFTLFVVVSFTPAQDSPFSRPEIVNTLSRPPAAEPPAELHLIRGVRSLGGATAIVHTDKTVLRTDDGGKIWQALPLRLSTAERIASVTFDAGRLFAVVENGVEVSLAASADGGSTWSRFPLALPRFEDIEAAPATGKLTFAGSLITLSFRLQTSSNFIGMAEYRSADGGSSWELISREIDIRLEDKPNGVISDGPWTLENIGECLGIKTGCYQRSVLKFAGSGAMPAELMVQTETAREKAHEEALETPRFSAPTGGPNRLSLNRGFDKCTAGTVQQMQTWWDTSWFHDANIYMSGRNRGCTQAQLSAAWVQQVKAMGWGLIPTIVGYQSPCIASTTFTRPRFSLDPAVAETQGREEAGIAVTDAGNLGLGLGTILYYDMERYDETAQTPGCRIATTAFLKGWTDRVRELGYESGTYGSPKNAQEDWVNLPPASKMHAIWMARWDNVMSVWTYISFPTFPTNEWANNQRIKQWQAPHDETWGGVTFNIDGNISDAPVFGNAIPRNQNADFDGDGKTDISVYRPEGGIWYVLRSSNSTFTATSFGVETDILAAGDFDGDGRTDYAIFRPADGTWHFLLKGLNYSTRQFGSAGDIPIAGDFNGDGKADIAVFRPSNGVWYIANSDSRGTFTFVQFGAAGDKPVQADYDGDGKTDIAVYRPESGVWYVLKSSDGSFTATSFGIETDLPAQGDFDADGKADFAVYRPADGLWYMLRTTEGFGAFQFGVDGDVPSTGDYDGDGRADLAVFRPSTGVWYLQRSQQGFYAAQFGVATDRSIPNAYLPAP
ncbi:MAG: DUF1906 domain-containing protein [Acidobacteria bacterium]|nr:DUF1906 domain-containing protein [Acidobacteriota bacterium]